MTLTVLFDLDDTLLQLNTRDFVPAYFNALGKAFSDLGPADQIIRQTQFAVSLMDTNQDPTVLLSEVFAENFYPPLGTTKVEQEEKLAAFYRDTYPELRQIVGVISEARTLIDWCKAQGFQIVVATNPIFPEPATHHRILWAGLEPQEFSFFTSFDNCHFTKPNMAYYAECLGRLGWPEGQVVMIGDTLSFDLLPMEKMGYPTFWVDPKEDNPDRPHGSLGEVQAWLSEVSATKPAAVSDSPEVSYVVLQSTPAVLDDWIKEIQEDAFQVKPSPDEWNLTEVFWHMADMETEVYLPQWEQFLVDPEALLTAPDTSRWAEERHYKDRSVVEGWDKFTVARKRSLECINDIKEKNLFHSSIQHTIFSQATVSELIAFTARHDRLHLHQCKALLDFYKIY